MVIMTEATRTVQFDAALRTLAGQARTRYAGEHARIDRALVIALNGGVTLTPDGSAAVQSSANAEVTYHVHQGVCDCPDFPRAPEGRCKHRYAACLVRKALKATAYYATTTDRQGLVLGGHIATAQAQREVDGDLAVKVGQPQYPDVPDAVATAKAAVAARQAKRSAWGF